MIATSPQPLPGRILRRLFLTLFLRGRSSRGLQKENAPKSVGRKLALTLLFYGLFGCFAFFFIGRSVFALSTYLHAMTFCLVGMFVAASAGEVLFNKEESDILLHRPVTPMELLWAKIAVLVEVSLWLALAFNLPGFFIGMGCVDGNWFFPLVHLVSVTVESLFCAGCVVLGYQLCIRWFGRERLEGLMTLAQVFIGIAAVLGGQIVPRVMLRYDKAITATLETWWVCLLPPAWFAGLNDAIAGQGDAGSWGLAGIGIVCTGLVLWLAFGKLAGDYDAGLRALQETSAPRPKKRSRRQWLQLLINTPLLRWWLGNSVERASFHLTSAYLLRDRDVKLRIYPGIAPTLALPLIILFGSRNPDDAGSFFIALSGMFLGTTAMLGMNLLQFSQQWQASDLFRVAPVHGPGQFCLGASRAVMTFLAVPLVMLIGVVAWASRGNFELLLLLVPGILTLPVFALFPCIGGKAIPLSHPTEEAKSARQGLRMFSAFIIASIMAAIASSAWSAGWFVCFLLCETAVVVVLRSMMRASLNRTQWSRLD